MWLLGDEETTGTEAATRKHIVSLKEYVAVTKQSEMAWSDQNNTQANESKMSDIKFNSSFYNSNTH